MRTIRINLQEVAFLDDFGVLVLVRIKKQFLASGGTIAFPGAPHRYERFLDMVRDEKNAGIPAPTSHHPSGILEHLGGTTIAMILDTRAMLTFVGDVCLSLTTLLRNPCRLRCSDTVIHMQRVGVDALPIVALISFLLGLIMAFMSAVQLEQFGANIYVASLVSLSMVRELGPIMTAIIVVGPGPPLLQKSAACVWPKKWMPSQPWDLISPCFWSCPGCWPPCVFCPF